MWSGFGCIYLMSDRIREMYGCFARLKIVAEITGPYSSLRKRVIGWNVLAGLKQLKIAKRKVELKKEKNMKM